MGAALCRKYQEPLSLSSSADDRVIHPPPKFLKSLLYYSFDEGNADTWNPNHPDVQYLMNYSILNFGAYEEHEPIYGPLAGFLPQQNKNRAQSQRESLPKHPAYPQGVTTHYIDNAHAAILYIETMGCWFAFMTISGYAYWPTFVEPFRRIPENASQLNRKIQVILPDKFYPEELSMPTHAHNAWQLLQTRESIIRVLG